MPTSLPVPSRGALRALRQLALGASCTVAVSAGLLTEDRRRRINTAREVHNNAKKLKSARQYHSAGEATIETFEDQALKYGDDAFWLPSNVLQNIEASIRPGGRSLQNHGPLQEHDQYNPDDTEHNRTSTLQEIPRATLPRIEKLPTTKKLFAGIPSQVAALPVSPREIKKKGLLINIEEDPLATMVASLKLRRTFDDGPGGPLSQESVDRALSLRKVCREEGRIELCDQIFDKALARGRMTEHQFRLFNPEDVISRLILSVNDRGPDPQKVSKAASTFLTIFTDQPEVMSEIMFSLGNRICSEASRSDMLDLAFQIFYRLESCRGDRFPPCAHLIKAAHHSGLHRKVVGFFRRFYTHTSPSQQEFFDICQMVISSAIKSQRPGSAEQILMVASQMGEKTSLFVPNQCVLRVLHHDWCMYHDIVRTRALFSRIEPVISSLQYPLEIYARIIQYCVEARDEDATYFYHDEVKRLYHTTDDARIYGAFALAKAYHKDWNGVLEQFTKAHKAPLSNAKILSGSFAHVLQQYALHHSLTEVEDYIDSFTKTFALKINEFTMNFMVSLYGEAKEIDSMVRWINCSVADGCSLDHRTIHNLLRKCHYTWNFSFEQVLQLFRLIPQKAHTSTILRSSDTTTLLRQLALKTRKSSTNMQLLQRYDNHTTDSQGVYRSMATTYVKRDYFTTLKIYNRAQKRQIPLGQHHLQVAVKASLRYHEGNADETTRFIKEAQQRNIPIKSAITAVFVYQTTQLTEDRVPFSRLVEVCSNTITAFEHANIEVPLAIITHTSDCLQKGGFHDQAIDIWNYMCSRLKIPPSSLDLASITTLLNAYIGLQDPAGIRWVGHMLSVNQQLWPDKQFKGLLKNARRMTTRLIELQPCSEQVHEFRDSIVELLQKIKVKRVATLEEQLEVRTKTIMIIEQAIADEKARRVGYKSLKLEPQQMSQTTNISANLTHEMQEDGISSGLEDVNSVDITSAQLAMTA